MSDSELTSLLPALGFYRSLKPESLGWGAVRAVVDAGDAKAALHAYARHLRERVWDSRLIDVVPARARGTTRQAAANEIVSGRVTLIGRTIAFEGAIDWTHAPDDLPDFSLMLNRHYHWEALAGAYRETGNRAYLDACEQQLFSWLRAMPAPVGDLREAGRRIERAHGHRRPFAPAWRTIEVGERLRDTWPKVLGTFMMQPGFSDEALVAMVASMVGQADFLLEFEGPQNWMYIESAGLLRVAGLLPGFLQADNWRKTSLRRVEEAVGREVYPSGAHEELTFWYQNVVRDSLAGIVDTAAAQGASVSSTLRQSLEALYESMSKAVQPDGLLPQVNDGDRLSALPILKEGASRFEREDFLSIASGGAEGCPPAYRSICLPEPGWAIMRSDWSPQAGYAFFDAGPFGGHAHEDKLGLILFAHGVPFLVDTGRSAYGDDAWRRFNIGPKAHSTVLFDGFGQCRRWWPGHGLARSNGPVAEGFLFSAGDEVDFASGAFGEMPEEFYYDHERGFRFVAHRRTILFLKPDRWLVIDRFSERGPCPQIEAREGTVRSAAPAQVTALFQLADHPYRLLRESSSLVSESAEGPAMTISWTGQEPLHARIVRGQGEPEILGWRFGDMAAGHRPVPIPVLSLECALGKRPQMQAYLISASPAKDIPREEYPRFRETPGGTVLEIHGPDAILARVTLQTDSADPLTWHGDAFASRLTLEWKDKEHVFPDFGSLS